MTVSPGVEHPPAQPDGGFGRLAHAADRCNIYASTATGRGPKLDVGSAADVQIDVPDVASENGRHHEESDEKSSAIRAKTRRAPAAPNSASHNKKTTISGKKLSDDDIRTTTDGGKGAKSSRPLLPWGVFLLAWNSGPACAFLAGWTFATIGLVVTELSWIPTAQIVLLRSAMTMLMMPLAGLGSGQQFVLYSQRKNLVFILLISLFIAAYQAFYYAALVGAPIGDAIALSQPTAFAAVSAFLLLGERLNLWQTAGIALNVAGVLLIVRPPILFDDAYELATSEMIALMLAVASALAATGIFLSLRVVRNEESPFTTALWGQVATLVLSIPCVLADWPEPSVSVSGAWTWFLLVALGALSLVGQLLINQAFSLTQAGIASAIYAIEVPIGYVYGMLLLQQVPDWVGVLGSTMVIGAILMVSLGSEVGSPAQGKPPPIPGGHAEPAENDPA